MRFAEAEYKPLPFEEAIKLFKDKVVLTPALYKKLIDEVKMRAFSVSGITEADILMDIYNEVLRGLEDGIAFNKFKKTLMPKVEQAWGGAAPYRLDTIFRTNIQSMYQAGRYKQQMEVVDERPYWQYVAVMDSRTRPAHAAMHGKVFPADHPFWETNYPPNGFNCFPSGTPVATSAGWKSIEDIQCGESIVGGSGNIHPVTAVHIRPFDGQLIRLVSEGISASMTPNHRVLTTDGWKRAESIKVGDVLVQIRKVASLDMPIMEIDQSDAERRYSTVSFPRKGKSAVSPAFYSELDIREKDIDPVFADAVIKDSSESGFFQKIKDYLFTFSLLKRCNRMARGFFGILKNLCAGHLFPYIFPSRGSRHFKFFRDNSGRRINVFSFAKSRMKPLLNLLAYHFRQPFPLHEFSFFGVNPLCFDGICTMSGFYPAMTHQPYERSIVDIPERTKLPVGEIFGEVAATEGFTDGAPLDAFHSLNNFRAWAFSHCILQRVENIERIPYIGNIFNLSVAKDESYCIPMCVVHNCRCTVRALSGREMKREGLSVSKKSKDIAEPGFGFNPGKAAWEPDMTKYPDWLRRKIKRKMKT